MSDLFNEKDIAEMFRHAESGYPFEVAGAIVGDGEGDDKDAANNRVVKFTNVQEQKHKEDPQHYRQDARTGYFADPKEVFEFNKKVQEEGSKILALYHSHPDNESYFSETDHDASVLWGEPTYPGAVYIVVSVVNGKAREAVVFEWDGKTYVPGKKLLLPKTAD